MSGTIKCPYCRESIPSNAAKCRYCHEFVVSRGAGSSETTKAWLEFSGKALLPLAALLALFSFRAPIEDLLSKQELHAEFLGTKISFRGTASFAGELAPLSLYYLIGSAGNFPEVASQLNYDVLGEPERAAIRSLEEAELVTATIEETPETEDQSFFGTQSLTLRPTEEGVKFLRELGLDF